MAAHTRHPQRTGFAPGAQVELVFLADVDALARPPKPRRDLGMVRTLGANGTRFSALLDDEVAGYAEVECRLGDVSQAVAREGWADIGTFYIDERYRRQRIASWLVGEVVRVAEARAHRSASGLRDA
jgi:GNAT superfamily N-acetyltransferase